MDPNEALKRLRKLQRTPYQTIKEHEGWTNKPTWAVNLWLSNDEGHYNRMRNGRDLVNQYNAKDKVRHYAGMIQGYVERECCPHSDSPTLEGDLLTWALAYVDWEEIAEAWLEES